MIETILRNTKLIDEGGAWVLLYNDRKYLWLLDATSRHDAEQQIAEMLFLCNQTAPQATPGAESNYHSHCIQAGLNGTIVPV